MDYDFIIKELLKEIHESKGRLEKTDGFYNAMYYRGRIEGLESALMWIESDKWANEVFNNK